VTSSSLETELEKPVLFTLLQTGACWGASAALLVRMRF
jgi:hypothetical protein